MRCGHSGKPTSRPCMPRTAPGSAPSTSTRCAIPCRAPDRPRAQAGDGGDRGQELLQRGRDRPEGDRPRRAGATCSPAASRSRAPRRSPSSWCATSTSRTRATRSSARSSRRIWPTRRTTQLEGLDPHRVPEHGALRDQRRRRPRSGSQAAAETYFSQPGEAADAARGGADRRPAAGAVGVQPAAPSDGGAGAPQRGAAGDARAGIHHRDASTRARCRDGLGLHPSQHYTRDPRAVHLRPRPAAS